MSMDPVCGMTVDASSAAAAWDYEGTTYYFCSVGCFDRFRARPEHFLSLRPDQRSMDD